VHVQLSHSSNSPQPSRGASHIGEEKERSVTRRFIGEGSWEGEIDILGDSDKVADGSSVMDLVDEGIVDGISPLSEGVEDG
jgi:hypothetical protein